MNQSRLCLILLLLSLVGTWATECGNGVLEDGEECDDGNMVDTDGCFANCTLNNSTDSCSCASGGYTTIYVDRPSWMNEMPPSLASDVAQIFSVECATNAECCFTITRPYVQNGVWSIGGRSLVPGVDTVPTDLPVESTSFQGDTSTSWVANNNASLPQGGCFERLSANAPPSSWDVSVEGCNVVQTYCFNPLAEALPFECKNTSVTSENNLPGLKVECDLYLDLLRPKHSNGGQPEWPTTDFLKWGNRLHTTMVFDMGVVVTSDLDYITPYINTRVNSTGYLVGNVELEYAGNDYTAVAIAESRLDSWDGLYADGTNATGVVQVDRNGDELGYQLSISGNNIVIVSNSIREVYQNTIYIRLTVENENGTLANVTLKVEIKAWNIVVDKSENPIGLDITPVIKIIQRNSNASVARDFATGVIPSYPVLSTEDIFVMEIPKTANQNLRLKTLTAELYEVDDNGDLAADPLVVLIDENQEIEVPMWEFQWGDDAYISNNDLSQVYSFRMATEAGNFAIVQTMEFEVNYGGNSKKFTVQQVTKPATLQTTTQLTLTIASTTNRNSGASNTVVDIAVAGTDADAGERVTISAGGNTAGTTGFTLSGPSNGGNQMLFAVAGGLVGLVTVLIVALVIVLIIRKRTAALNNQLTMEDSQQKQLQMDIQL